MAWEMKGNALAGTDLIKIWSLSERKGGRRMTHLTVTSLAR